MNFKALQTLIILSLVLSFLSGCGRKNPPEQLDPNGYPHPYPATSVEVIH